MDDDDNELERGPWFPLEMDQGKRRIVRNLVLAAKNGKEETVEEILESGEVDVDSKYRWETALMVAARMNNITLCRTLLNFGADCNISRLMQQTALWIAAYHGNLEAMEMMTATGKCSQVNLDNALRRCVKMKFLHGCDALLRAGADVEATDSLGFTSLHVAAGITEEYERAKAGHWKFQNPDNWKLYHATSFEICELLIMWQADVTASDSTLATPLHYACETGNDDICGLLIESGAEINAIGGPYRKTPLHVAVSKDFPNLVKMLMQNPKIHPNISDGDKETPLMSAIQLHKKECVRIFLEDERWADFMSVVSRVDPSKNEIIETPMRQLIREMPDMAALVMNKCIELSSYKDPKNPDFLARFNFTFLDDTYTCATWSTTDVANGDEYVKLDGLSTPVSTLGRGGKDNEALDHLRNSAGRLQRKQTVVESGMRPGDRKKDFSTPPCDPRSFNCSPVGGTCTLNKHVEAYTNNKRVLLNNHPLFIANHEKTHAILCHPLTIALVNYKWNKIARCSFYGGLFMYIIFVGLLTAQVTLAKTKDMTNNVSLHVISVTLIVMCILAIGLEIFSMANEFPSYMFKFGHWFDLVIYITAIVHVLDSAVFNKYLKKYSLAAVCIFAAWFNILLTLRQFPVIGIFFIMFTRILKNSCIVLSVFFPLIVGFAMTYSIILGNDMPLFRVDKSIATILVMLSGEVEFVDTMTETDGMKKSILNSKSEWQLAIIITLYVFFIVLMVICLLNLLVGLAVSDVETLHRESKAEMMSLRAQKVIACEYFLAWSVPRRRAACGCIRLKPNKNKLWCGKDLVQRIKAWFNVLEFNDICLSPAYLIKIKRTEKPDTSHDVIRKEISNLKNQLDNANVLSPRVVRSESRMSATGNSKRFEVPGARVLKKTNGIAKENYHKNTNKHPAGNIN